MATRKYELYGQEFKMHAYETFAEMRMQDPIICQPGMDGRTMIWFLTRYEDIERMLLDKTHFSRNFERLQSDEEREEERQEERGIFELIGNHMLNKDGEEHQRLRMLVSKAFTPKRINELRPRVQEITEELLAPFLDRGEMDLMNDFAFHLPTIVIAELLGIPPEDRDRFKAWSAAVITPALTEDAQRDFMRLMTEFIHYLRETFEARRRMPQDDLLTALLQAEEAGDSLSEQELFSTMVLLIVAGHETTVSLIGNAVAALLGHPEQMAMLQAEPGLMRTAVEEFLRYDGPVERALNRFVIEDFRFGEHDFKRGDIVIGILGAAAHDSEIFEDPEKLVITRTPNPHLGFGKGIHYCLGAPLARLEAEIALNTLLERIPDLELAIDPSEFVWMPTPGFRRLSRLPVRWPPGGHRS